MKSLADAGVMASTGAGGPADESPRATGSDALVTLQDAARLTGRNAELLRRWCVAGRIDGRRVGRDWLVSREELARIDAMPRRGRARGRAELVLDDRTLLNDAVNADLDGCLEPGEAVELVLPGADDSVLLATDRRVFLVRDGVLIVAPKSGATASWPLASLRRVQLEAGTTFGALVVVPRRAGDRALVVLLARPHLARGEAAANALRQLIIGAAKSH